MTFALHLDKLEIRVAEVTIVTWVTPKVNEQYMNV